MIAPRIAYYACMEDSTGNGKTPKYTISRQAGFYPAMEELVGKDGKISMYLLPSRESGVVKDNAPAMRLQAKNALNFTGLRDYFEDGRLSGYAYGYPLQSRKYAKGDNPFFEYKDDAYLFLIHQGGKDGSVTVRPSSIEMLVLDGAKVLAAAYCKQLVMGGFDEILGSLRKQAI